VTHKLLTGSSRLVHARRFGAELDRAMKSRGVGARPVVAATGVTRTSIRGWRRGDNIPRTETAQRLADALAWPKLVAIAREARTAACERCGRSFVNEGGGPKRYCNEGCRLVDEQLRRPSAGVALHAAVRAAAEARLANAPERETLPAILDALGAYERSDARHRLRVDQQGRVLEDHRTAVAAMCAACEPEGRCRDGDCPLRSVSPLPLEAAPMA
jgi:transcriptional regulator with XRE-family HTH domain